MTVGTIENTGQKIDRGAAQLWWQQFDPLRGGPSNHSGMVPAVRYFGRYRGGWIRDGVLLSVS